LAHQKGDTRSPSRPIQDERQEIRDVLDTLAAASARWAFGPPVDAGTIQLVDVTLRKAGFGGLPSDYAVLLAHANGIQGPHFTLLSPGGMALAGGGVQPGIGPESEAFDDGAVKSLVLGKVSGGVFLVFAEGEYRLVDVLSRDVLRRYDRVAAFISDMLDQKAPAGR